MSRLQTGLGIGPSKTNLVLKRVLMGFAVKLYLRVPRSGLSLHRLADEFSVLPPVVLLELGFMPT